MTFLQYLLIHAYDIDVIVEGEKEHDLYGKYTIHRKWIH